MAYSITRNSNLLSITFDSDVINLVVSNIIAIHKRGDKVEIVYSYKEDKSNKFGTNVISLHYDDCTSPTFASVDELETYLIGVYNEAGVNGTDSNAWDQYTEVVSLVTAQDLTASYADFGVEIDMIGYTKLGIWVTSDVNDSLDVTLKILAKHTSAGADEYEIDGVDTRTLWSTTVADFKKYYEVEIGAVPIIQLQAIAGTVGATAGDLTISITKIY